MQKVVAALRIINLLLMLAVLIQLDAAVAQIDTPVLRGRALELVDAQRKVRAHLGVEPEGEVVLRLRDETGAIRVKLSAGKGGSGIVLLNDATQVGVHILAKADGSSMKLVNRDAREKLVAP